MARFVFAWEMGANYGHISGFAPVAHELERRGHELVAILQNVHDARHFFSKNVRIVQAPHCKPRPRGEQLAPQITYADLIRNLGYSDPTELAMLVRVWRSALELAGPALTIYDSAPTALLASRGLPFIKVTLGSAFAVPPPVRPLPLLNSRMKVPFAEHEKREASVVKVANAALAELGLGQIEALREVFNAEIDLIRGVPELDHYGARKGGEYVGAGYSLDAGADLDFPPGEGPKIFMYVRRQMKLEPLLRQVASMRARVLAVIPDMDPSASGRVPSHVRLSREPAKLRRLVETADLCVCHSAVGTGTAFLLGGVPLMLIPLSTEQAMVASRVYEQGMGLAVPDQPNANYQGAMQRVTEDPSFREAARKLAAKYTDHVNASTTMVCDRLEAALSRAQA